MVDTLVYRIDVLDKINVKVGKGDQQSEIFKALKMGASYSF